MNDKYILVRYRACWADEFELEGYIVTTDKIFTSHLNKAEKRIKRDEHVELYFGTNESLMIESIEDYKRWFEVEKALTKEQFQVFQECFGKNYGNRKNFIVIGMVCFMDV